MCSPLLLRLVQLNDEDYILVKDLKVETVSWSIPFVNISRTSQTDIPKGELLIRKGGWLHVRGNQDAAFKYEIQSVAPLELVQRALLEAIPTPKARFSVFVTEGWMDWGVAVKTGDVVYIRISMKDDTENCCSTALVHYIGRLTEDEPGTIFGVEIKVSYYYPLCAAEPI